MTREEVEAMLRDECMPWDEVVIATGDTYEGILGMHREPNGVGGWMLVIESSPFATSRGESPDDRR